MKIKPLKNYKKPLYAIGLSAAIMAVALTGCTDPANEETTADTESIRQQVVDTITGGIVYIHTK